MGLRGAIRLRSTEETAALPHTAPAMRAAKRNMRSRGSSVTRDPCPCAWLSSGRELSLLAAADSAADTTVKGKSIM